MFIQRLISTLSGRYLLLHESWPAVVACAADQTRGLRGEAHTPPTATPGSQRSTSARWFALLGSTSRMSCKPRMRYIAQKRVRVSRHGRWGEASATDATLQYKGSFPQGFRSFSTLLDTHELLQLFAEHKLVAAVLGQTGALRVQQILPLIFLCLHCQKCGYAACIMFPCIM